MLEKQNDPDHNMTGKEVQLERNKALQQQADSVGQPTTKIQVRIEQLVEKRSQEKMDKPRLSPKYFLNKA